MEPIHNNDLDEQKLGWDFYFVMGGFTFIFFLVSYLLIDSVLNYVRNLF